MGNTPSCLPCARAARYREDGDHPAQYRQSLAEMLRQDPALFPHDMDQGLTLHDADASGKHELIIRRMTLQATGAVCTLRPSFVIMPEPA